MQSARSSVSCATSARLSARVLGDTAAPAPQPASRMAVVQVGRGFHVNGDAVGAGTGDLGHVTFGVLDHQMCIDDRPGAVDTVGDRAEDAVPKLIEGTKWPSMTSTWTTRAPAASTSSS